VTFHHTVDGGFTAMATAFYGGAVVGFVFAALIWLLPEQRIEKLLRCRGA
jgi:hypothetical protein